jgi:hypothetical protein
MARERQVATTRVRAATAAGVGALCGPRPSACCQSGHGIVCLVCLPVASLRHVRLIRPKCKRGACLTPGLPCLEWAACRDARRLDGTRVRALRPVCAARGGRGCRRPSRARAPAAGCFRGTSSTTLDRAGVRLRKAGGLRPAGSRPVHATLPGARCHARTFYRSEAVVCETAPESTAAATGVPVALKKRQQQRWRGWRRLQAERSAHSSVSTGAGTVRPQQHLRRLWRSASQHCATHQAREDSLLLPESDATPEEVINQTLHLLVRAQTDPTFTAPLAAATLHTAASAIERG